MKRVARLWVAIIAVALGGAVAQAEVGYVVYTPVDGDCGCGPVAAAYYAPAPVVAYRGPVYVWSRYRPILGGTVTRVIDYSYGPAIFAPVWR